jgi:hypothetical protein
MVGGGVRGKGAGIAHGTIIQVGSTIEGPHLFMQGYLQAGGMTTGIVVGEGINGTTSEYLTNNFNGTGGAGKKTDIGRSDKLGVFKVCDPERDHNSRLERCNRDSPNHNTERANRSTHSHNTGRRHENPNLKRENLEEGRKKKGIDRIGGRMMKSLSY